MKEKVKYLIVGQGLVGTWMSYFLQKRNISFKIINDAGLPAATSAASGVINPVTGRRIVQTWMIDTLLPFAVQSYQAMSKELNIELIKKAPVVLIHPSEQMKESFEYRLTHDNVYLYHNDALKFSKFFKVAFGTGEIDECYWMDLNTMITQWRKYLIDCHFYIAAKFDISDLKITAKGIEWNQIQAEKIIFCDGINSLTNPFFNALPFAPNKGEALIIKVPGLSNANIYKNKISIVPWKDDLFWVGSSYEWHFEDNLPSESFKQKIIDTLNQFLKLPYEVVDHISGIRPANTERRPFVGLHPSYPQLGICNGMGTKGCSLAPYFSKQLIDHIEIGSPLLSEADIHRFRNKLIH